MATKAKKSPRRLAIEWAIVLGIVGYFGVGLVIVKQNEPPEERARRAAVHHQEEELRKWRAAHPELVAKARARLAAVQSPSQEELIGRCQAAIKPSLRNPRSVQWVEPWNWRVRDGKVEAVFRAENGFGGMNLETTICGE